MTPYERQSKLFKGALYRASAGYYVIRTKRLKAFLQKKGLDYGSMQCKAALLCQQVLSSYTATPGLANVEASASKVS